MTSARHLTVAPWALLIAAGTLSAAPPDSLNMRMVGSWPFGPACAVAVDTLRNLVFLGSGGGVYVLDASNPAALIRKSDAVRTGGPISGLGYDHANKRLYAVGKKGLEIWDVSDETSPSRLGASPVSAWRVAIAGSYAYLARGIFDVDSGIVVLDVSVPSAVTVAGYCAIVGTAEDVAVAGSYAYVAAGSGGLRVIDISDPHAPHEVAHLTDTHYAAHIVISGQYVFLGELPGEIPIIDISIPTAPFTVSGCGANSRLTDIAVSHGCLCATSINPVFGGELAFFDVSSPSNPLWAGGSGTPQSWAVALFSDHAYVADQRDGLYVLDVSDPSSPRSVSKWRTPCDVVDITVAGQHAYAAAEQGGLRVLDVATDRPTEVASYPLRAYSTAIDVSGNYAYLVACWPPPPLPGSATPEYIRVFDVTSPSSPILIDSTMTHNPGYDIAVGGPSLCVAESDSGLEVCDISSPGDVKHGTLIDLPGNLATAVGTSGAHACVVGGVLSVLDVELPSTPLLMGTCTPTGGAYGVVVPGRYAYTANGDSGLSVIDVAALSAPNEVGHCPLPGFASDVAAAGGYAYVAAGGSGVRMVDVSDPGAPKAVGFHATPGDATHVAAAGRRVYVATEGCGVQVYENLLLGVEEDQEPPVPHELTVTGRWVGPDLELRLGIPRSGDVKVNVFNALGQEVASQSVSVKAAGARTIRLPCSGWSAGAYFVRVETGAHCAAAKLVKLRQDQ